MYETSARRIRSVVNAGVIAGLFFQWQTGAVQAGDLQLSPFRTVNQRPLAAIFGFPQELPARIVPAGKTAIAVSQDITSEHTENRNAREEIFLDGELYRWTISARYGMGDRYEVGIAIPYLFYGGGFLDSFIIDWHRFFGFPQGGRDTAPRNRLLYRYSVDGVQRFTINSDTSGIGDVSLTGGIRLHESDGGDVSDAVAVRASLKLPTGDSGSLRGSGSTDCTIAVSASRDVATALGNFGLFGSVGGLFAGRGRVLADQQNQLAAFGSVAVGWGVNDSLAFTFQLNAHTPMFHGSTLDEISRGPLVLTTGGSIKLPGEYHLDLGVSEGLNGPPAPDVSFHLAVGKQF